MCGLTKALIFWFVCTLCGVLGAGVLRPFAMTFEESSIVVGGQNCFKNGIEDCEVGDYLECDQIDRCTKKGTGNDEDPFYWECETGTIGYTDLTEHFENCVPTDPPANYDNANPVLTDQDRHVTQICYKYQFCGAVCGDPDTMGERFCKAGPSTPKCPQDDEDCRRKLYECENVSGYCEPASPD